MIIYGWQQYARVLAVLQLLCSRCGNTGDHVLRKLTTKFTLFWIPLFPINKKHTLFCTACASEQKLPKEQALAMAADPRAVVQQEPGVAAAAVQQPAFGPAPGAQPPFPQSVPQSVPQPAFAPHPGPQPAFAPQSRSRQTFPPPGAGYGLPSGPQPQSFPQSHSQGPPGYPPQPYPQQAFPLQGFEPSHPQR
ncbi:MAG TPA: zinc-ribbon domain-containing protein [Actinophytocola sp.]|uniref:zinc ribbon domain-containing protein n=1 Tax=Actinophytocola sp. TaxID=1872138 RepID=UPI002F9219BD